MNSSSSDSAALQTAAAQLQTILQSPHLSQAEKLQLLTDFEARLDRRDFSNQRTSLEQNFEAFVREFWDEVPGAGTMSWNWHMSILCSELQILAERVFQGASRLHDLIFNVSPGTSKSTIGSILFPAWTWTRMPSARHICASHTETLVLDLAAKARYVIQSEKFHSFWPVQLRADQSTKSYYANTSGGDRLSCTVGGKSPTGFHAHFLTCLPGSATVTTPQGELPIAALVPHIKPGGQEQHLTAVEVLGFDHAAGRATWQQINQWQRSPGRRLLRIRCHHDNPSTQAIILKSQDSLAATRVDASTQATTWKSANNQIQTYLDSQVRGWVGPESGQMKICSYGEVVVPLPTVFKNLDNQSTQEVDRTTTNDKFCAIKPPDLEQVDWEELYRRGMTGDEWILAGRPHWQCYSCRQIFVTIPIPAKFICPLCQDKDNITTPSERNSPGQEVEPADYTSVPFAKTRTVPVRYHLGDSLSPLPHPELLEEGQEVETTADLFLECTEDHPVYVHSTMRAKPFSRRYHPARDLLPGDVLLGLDDSSWIIQSIEVLPDIPEFVYNLETFPNHNFFANGVLVHNCDDPIDPKRAVSEAELKTAADFVTNILPSRKVDKAVSVTTLIMQRLHDVDPTGVLLAKAKQYAEVGRIRHVCLPARLADNILPVELRNRYTDGLMDSDRLPEIILREQEILLGSYSFSGQYMQAPVPLSGGMFKVDYFNQRVKAAPFDAQRVLYIDRASTQDGGCYTAMVLLARAQDGSAFFVEHCVHGQWEPDERNRRTRAEALRCRARYGTHEPLIYIEAEGGSSGRDSYKGVARTLAGFSVREHRPTGRKEVRAEPWACQLAAGNVFIVEDGSRSWDIENYIQEHVHFPLGKYKDQVDSSSGGFSLLIQQRPAGGLRSYRLQHHRKKGLQVVLCSPEQLAGLELTRRCLLVFLKDPDMVKGVMSDAEGVLSGVPDDGRGPEQSPVCEDKQLGKEVMSTVRNGSQSGDREGQEEASRAGRRVEEQGKEVVPAHSLPAVLDSLTLDFLPNSPADFQESWDAVLPDYGTTAEGLLLTREKSKRFWAFATRHRDPWAEAVVLVDDNEQRLLAAGLACCDGLGLPRNDTLAWTGRDSWQASRDTKAEAVFIYEQLRAGRNLVV